jgi:alpha-L-rhamnosidase
MDGRVNPLAVRDDHPLLSWRLADARPGAQQGAYRILVASSAENLAADSGNLWDSGMVESTAQSVRYAGKPIAAGGAAFWKVQYRDPAHGESPWSEVAVWETGLPKAENWENAAWITGQGAFDQRHKIPASALGHWLWHAEPVEKEQLVSFVREIEIPAGTLAIKAELLTAARSRDGVVTMTAIVEKDGRDWRLGPTSTWTPLQSGMGDVYGLAAGKQYLVLEAKAQGDNPAITAGLKIELSDGQLIEIMADDSWKSMVGRFRGDAAVGRLSPVAVHGAYGDNPGEMREFFRPEPMPSPLLRRDFTLDSEIKSARAYVAALGFAELYLNGNRVGDAVLDPAQTNFEHYSFYVAHDVTDMVKTGQNAIGIILGDGWYGQNQWLWSFGHGNMHYGKPSVRVKLVVDFTDGSREEVVSDPTWKTIDGPILTNNIWAGERFDARRIKDGWSQPGYDDSGWQPVLVEAPDIPALLPSPLPPIRRHAAIDIKEVHEPAPGVYVIDFGQHIAGWTRIKISEKPGTRVRLRFAEQVNADQTLNFRSIGTHMHGLMPTVEYFASGAAEEIWEPRFTYHAFRYAEVHGLSARPQKGDIVAVPVHTALENRGDFHSSDPIINRIHGMARWTLLNNVHGKQTDCPGRERDEWNADAQVSAEFAIYNFDMLPLYNNLVDNIVTSPGMTRHGIPGEIAVGKRGQRLTDVGWGTALIAIPWYLHVYYGDTSAAEQHWEKMVAFVDWIGSVSENYVPSRMRWSDHASIKRNLDGSDIPPCDKFALGMIHYCYSAQKMATLAEAIDRPGEVEQYRKLAADIAQAFTARFLDKNTLSHGHQTIDAMALKYDMVPAEFRAGVAASLEKDVRARDYGVIGGIYGHQPIFEELLKAGYIETAWRAMRSTSVPGVPYSIEKDDATTIWEAFWPEDHPGFIYVSKNHPMFGSINAVYYGYIAGIRPDPQHPGFRRFILKPDFTAHLPSARATHESPFGRIVSDWKRDADEFHWHVTVPPGTTAEAHVPGADKDGMVWTMPCGADPEQYVVHQRSEDGFEVFSLAPGTYQLQTPQKAR